jgi:hypothetical protein
LFLGVLGMGGAIAVVAVSAGAATPAQAGVARAAKPAVVGAARFTELARGWRAFDRDFGLLTHRGADVNSYALSWAYKPGPFGWANSMPPRAIAVSVILIRRNASESTANLCAATPHLPGFAPIRRLPLRLPRTTTDRQEGQPQVLEYRVFGRLDDSYNIDLRVDVNDTKPTTEMLRIAQRVASGIRFPTWPRRRAC